jgi:hypothetical protein
VPERKGTSLGDLDRLTPKDPILASNKFDRMSNKVTNLTFVPHTAMLQEQKRRFGTFLTTGIKVAISL